MDGFNPDFKNTKYKNLFIKRLNTRVDYINKLYGHDILPAEASKSIMNLINKLK
jgi:hypothetical protein